MAGPTIQTLDYEKIGPGTLPAEIWLLIIDDSLTNPELKQVRLVSTAFYDYATPHLFRHVYFSLNEPNMKALANIAASPHLRNHVKSLYIDPAVYYDRVVESAESYASKGEEYFSQLLGTTPEVKEPRLSATMLRKMLIAYPEEQVARNLKLPVDLVRQFRAGFRSYNDQSRYQGSFGAARERHWDACFVDALILFKNVTNVELHITWKDASASALKEYLYPSLHETNGTSNYRSCFRGPGPMARNMHPLHLPPQVGPRTFQFVVPTVSRLFRGLFVERDAVEATVPMTGIMGTGILNPGIYRPLVQAFRPLKYLSLRLGCLGFEERQAGILRPTLFDYNTWSLALQGMSEVETLEILFQWDGWKVNELYKVMLQPQVENMTKSFCHRDDHGSIFDNAEYESNIWTPDHEIPNYTSAQRKIEPRHYTGEAYDSVDGYVSGYLPPQPTPRFEESIYRLRVLNPNPWPKLRKLSLQRMHCTPYDLASLMISIAPTLRDLTLHDITLGRCPCHRGIRSGVPGQHWAETGPASWLERPEERPVERERWYDTLIMLSKVLRLDACDIALLSPQDRELAWRMGDAPGLEKLDIIEKGRALQYGLLSDNNLLGKYVLEAAGRSPALWLLEKVASGNLPTSGSGDGEQSK